jgi:hypothetical protein
MYTFPCTSGRRGGLIDVYFIIVRAYCHHYRVLQKKKASQKNPKPYPKKELINTNSKEKLSSEANRSKLNFPPNSNKRQNLQTQNQTIAMQMGRVIDLV